MLNEFFKKHGHKFFYACIVIVLWIITTNYCSCSSPVESENKRQTILLTAELIDHDYLIFSGGRSNWKSGYEYIDINKPIDIISATIKLERNDIDRLEQYSILIGRDSSSTIIKWLFTDSIKVNKNSINTCKTWYYNNPIKCTYLNWKIISKHKIKIRFYITINAYIKNH